MLVEDAMSGVTEAGFPECVPWVAEQGDHARSFHRQLGFHPDDGRDGLRGLPVVRYRTALPLQA